MQITCTQKRVCKDFEITNSREYHGLHVQSNTLLLVDVSENFWNMCLEIYELDPVRFLTALARSLKKCLSKIRSIN